MKERLRSSRVPERVAFVDELPYNETGKLLRRKVRARPRGASGALGLRAPGAPGRVGLGVLASGRPAFVRGRTSLA